MPGSEWARSTAFQPALHDRRSRTVVNNPPSAEAVLYRWRVENPRLLHREYLFLLASRVNWCARRFSCRSVITQEYVIAFANEQLYRRGAWDRYIDWHRDCLHEEGLLDSQIPDFKWFLYAEWQVDCGRQHSWCIRPARRLDLAAVVALR